MGIFSHSSPFDTDVEKATNEKNTTEDWAMILDICDKVGTSQGNAKDCLRSIFKRLNHTDPHVVLHAITLLDACSNNCGKVFHLEIASREFETELRKLITKMQPKTCEKLKGLLKKWAEGDFKTDPQLSLIPSLYNKLKSEGIDFSSAVETPKHSIPLSRDPNVVSNSQEEEDIAKAIELSLKENKQHPSTSHGSPASKKSSSLYPSVNSMMATTSNAEGRKVRALYDFEAAEDNELTFMAGEIIHILDDSDQNWWKGNNHRGEGLFPSNFVTADLSAQPEIKPEHSKKLVQFSDEVEVKTVKREPEVIEVEIDEHKMDRLMHLLHEADPQSDSTDPPEMLDLEEQVTAMGPLIDAALEKTDRQHATLTQLSSDLVDALNLYHTLMREPHPAAAANYILPKMPPPPHMNAYPFPNQGPPPPSHMFNGMPPQPQTSFNPAAGPPGHFNPNMPRNEYMGPTSMPSMTMPQHFHMQPGQHQQIPGQPQVPEQTSLPYQPQGFPPQPGTAPGPYNPQGPSGLPTNQQPQYAPNGQHMM